MIDDLKELNLGTSKESKPIFVSALLSADKIDEYYQLLMEYKDVFPWTYKEMPDLDPTIAVRHLVVKPGTQPIKQTQRCYRSELIPQVEAEIDMLIETCLIREVQYPKWISNIVIVLKKSRQIRVYVDFHDLNDACPKDDFPLPIIKIMVDATTGHKALSLMDKLCEKYKLKQHKSSMYYAPTNGLAETFNKKLCNIVKKVIGRTKRDWHERTSEALWAYRTTHMTPTQVTHYSLVYGVEAVLPFESQIPSLKMAIQEGLTEEENTKLRLQELEALDERRLEAQQHLECYQPQLFQAFNKKVRPRSFQIGNLVLALRKPIIITYKTESKFTSKWDGLYVIQKVYTNDAYLIMVENGLKISPINGRFLKHYYL
ncbi:uncharacterized protein LOC126605154 [Malus sylvestris]|uniref:uncharacterized protein LOC126605154 n=1 Tax=Malus sylvestris TaxID=3752 RepID=UPI0021AC7605|nr:uncharacterized protein LOC126605154 [Malus sylvestris]